MDKSLNARGMDQPVMLDCALQYLRAGRAAFTGKALFEE